MKKRGKIIIIAGPTGSGESSVTEGVLKSIRNTKRIITATTRSPRLNEKNGKDYFFFSPEQFRQKIKRDDFLEYTYIKNRRQYYGTLKKWMEMILNKGYNLIGNLDVVGARFYKKEYNALTIFIKPEKFSLIKERLLKRQPGMPSKILEKRLANARQELKDAKYYDYVVINYQNKLKETIQIVNKIIKKYLSNYS